MSYFLVSVSNRRNLELCVKYALAGFTDSGSGLWTFLEIEEGDFVSFLYGARAFNLYKVTKKEALREAEKLPPWPPVTFRMSGKTYYFPFRLNLHPVRAFDEPLVRAEFAYVAENLLLRGGYRKTHFQADQTTLQAVSQMGSLHNQSIKQLKFAYEAFIPKVTTDRAKFSPPEVFRFSEFILQVLIRHYLSSSENLDGFLLLLGVDNLDARNLEVLGEKALPEGHIDILIKESVTIGIAKKIIVEVKTGEARIQDVDQITAYIEEIGVECLAGVIVARNFSRRVAQEANNRGVKTLVYSIGVSATKDVFTFEEAQQTFQLQKV